jgi:hypothetical protein
MTAHPRDLTPARSPARAERTDDPTRLLLWDSAAFSLLPRELIGTVGEAVARRIFHRFGFANGEIDFTTVAASCHWDHIGDQWLACLAILRAEGKAQIEPLRVVIDPERGVFEVELILRCGYESFRDDSDAESTEPACWALTGYLAGFSTALFGSPEQFEEQACRGHLGCESHLVGPIAAQMTVTARLKEPETIAAVERRHVLQVLARCGGNRTHAARALGIGANTLWRKLKQWGVPPARPS